MRKMYSVALIIIMMFSLISCGGKAKDANPPAAGLDALLSGELSGEITVSFFENMFYEKFIDEAAYLFEFDHPGVTINVVPYSMDPEIMTIEIEGGYAAEYIVGWDDVSTMDYINRINTELMSGKGPDILAVDVLSYYKYAESGAFEDLLPYMDADKDFDINDYRQAILEGTRYKSGQYMLPMDFGFRVVLFNKNLVDNATAATLKDKGRFTWMERSDPYCDN